MNIFYFDNDYKKCAQMLCDKHIIKMILETAQLLCNAHDKAPYNRTHYNHPCSKWVRQSLHNYLWLCEYGLALCKEYTYRYGKVHKTKEVIDWCLDNYPELPVSSFTEPPLVTSEYNNYIDYYNSKDITKKWTNREIPTVFKGE